MNILDGKQAKLQILNDLKEKINKNKITLGLTVIQIGNDDASNVYIKSKNKMAQDLGINFNHIHLEDNVLEEEVLDIIAKLNNDDFVDGILIEMPIPKRLDSKKILNSINELKDVDGLTDINMGKLSHGIDSLVPCTPMGIIDLLKINDISIEGKCVVIIGRSDLVGKPLASLMLNENATVIQCHSKTKNLYEYTKMADILVSAVGKPKLITKEMVKKDAVVIDVGINRTQNGIVGDVDFEEVKKVASYITPVPGGVGQMTIAELAKNIYKAHTIRKNNI